MIAVLPILAAQSHWTVPAEWEPQDSVWMSWATYDNKRGYSVNAVQTEIIRALKGRTAVDLIVSSDGDKRAAQKKLKAFSHVRYHVQNSPEIWVRDFGPNLLRTATGFQSVTFRFNYWGYGKVGDAISQPADRIDEWFTRRTPNALPLRTDLVSEGGNREFNGQGVMMAVAAVERQRNPHLSLSEIEEEHRRLLGVQKVIWLGEGGAEDDLTFLGPLPGDVYTVITTGGHVDNVARFADPNTILLAEVTAEEAKKSPIAAISRRRLERNLQLIKAARNLQGKPFRIVRMPSPDLMFTTMTPGDGVYDFISELSYRRPFPKGKPVKVVQAASYLNFLISNGLVITSKFWKPGLPNSIRQKDAAALAVLKKHFPGRTVIALDSEAVNLGGGGIHCITQQTPAGS